MRKGYEGRGTPQGRNTEAPQNLTQRTPGKARQQGTLTLPLLSLRKAGEIAAVRQQKLLGRWKRICPSSTSRYLSGCIVVLRRKTLRDDRDGADHGVRHVARLRKFLFLREVYIYVYVYIKFLPA